MLGTGPWRHTSVLPGLSVSLSGDLSATAAAIEVVHTAALAASDL